MGPAQMLHQRIYDADVCLRQSGDADGGGAVHIQKVVRGYVEDTGQFHNVLRGGSGYAHLPCVHAGPCDAQPPG